MVFRQARKKFPPGLQSSAETGLLRSGRETQKHRISFSCRRKTSRNPLIRRAAPPRREGGRKDPKREAERRECTCYEQYQHCRHAKAVADQHREPATNSVTAFTAFPIPGIIPAVRQSAICRRGIERRCDQIRIICIPTSTPSDDFKRPFTQVSSSSVIWDKISLAGKIVYKGDEQIDMDHRRTRASRSFSTARITRRSI